MTVFDTPIAPNPVPLHFFVRGPAGISRRLRHTVGGLALCLLTAWPATAVELVSININDVAGNSASSGVAVNADGSFVAFYSDATDLVTGDTNQARDVFVRNRPLGTTERVSLSSAGAQANRASHAVGDAPAINGDGQIVAFYSDATNLAPNDTNGVADVFVRLRSAGTTDRISFAADGAQGNGPSINPSIDAEGRFVAFQSQATNLIPGDTNDAADIFVRDRMAGTTERICNQIEGNDFSFAPSISADGNFVAFTSAATNLVASDLNRRLDIFVCDRRTGAIDLVSVSSEGVQGNGDSILPAISADGRYVAFKSIADNLVPDDLNRLVDVFVRDRVAGTTQRVSVNVSGGDANDASFPPSISYDGRFVAFGSAASNLVLGDVNSVPSVFVRDLLSAVTLLVDLNDRGEQANAGTPDIPPSVSGDGRQIGYVSLASNLSFTADQRPNDRNQTFDVYIGRNPFFCPDGMCPPHLMCQNGICIPEVFPTSPPTRTGGTFTPTPTATATPGPNDCCQCGTSCQVPSVGMCPAACDLVRSAACLDALGGIHGSSEPGNCATFTATPARTPTAPLGVNDCCQCSGPACQAPANGVCPVDCSPVRSAACLGTGTCATFTPAAGTPTPMPTAPLGVSDCCQCSGPACQAPANGACPVDCSPVRSAACLGTGTCATFTPAGGTPTPMPTAPLGANDCCQCSGPACQAPANGACPVDCSPVRSAACLGTGNCATFTPAGTPTRTAVPITNNCCQCPTPGPGGNSCQQATPDGCPAACSLVPNAACETNGLCVALTPTPTPGRGDCCQCEGPACSMAVDGQCPSGCTLYQDTDCLGNICAVTPTIPPPTLGPQDCCQCGAEQCQAPGQGTCPAQCTPVRGAACLAGNCATFTATATPTGSPPTAVPTLSPNRCCQCAAEECQAPLQDGTCPAQCTVVDSAACLPSGRCATFTPTPPGPTQTATATLGANDCCQCADQTCQPPSLGTCPGECIPVRAAACLASGNCATFTPTPPGPTQTPTATLGANDCCQCADQTCQPPSLGTCPGECIPVRAAACLASGNCATFTPTPPGPIATATGPTPTPTATLGANDCCQCADQTCQPPSLGTCPGECIPVRAAACLASGNCATFTPTATTTRTGGATVTAAPATGTPTGTAQRTPSAGATGTATRTPIANTPGPELDKDACQCAVTAESRRSGRGAIIWLAGVVALVGRRRARR